MQSIPRTLGIAVSAYWLFARHTYFQVNRKGNIQKNRLTSAHPEALPRSEEHTSELQSQSNLVCRLLLEKKNRDHRPGDDRRAAGVRTGRAPAGRRSPPDPAPGDVDGRGRVGGGGAEAPHLGADAGPRRP